MSYAHLCTRYPANEKGLEILGRAALASWGKYDLIFSASKSSEYLLRPRKPEGPSMIFDLSVPRNVDPEVGKMEEVSLFNIEQLHLLLKKRGEKAFDLFHLEEMVRTHTLRLCSAYRKKQGRIAVCNPVVNYLFLSK